MRDLTAAEVDAANTLVALALAEDLGPVGDVTSRATIPADLTGHAVIVARTAGVIAGMPIVRQVLAHVDRQLVLETRVADGAAVQRGDVLAVVSGSMRSILTAERTALNFLQRLSGIATTTARYVQAAGSRCQVLDTRKTTPGWRLVEKYAVRCGGGHNHRVGLFDGILIKDNHLAALGGPDAIRRAVAAARQQFPSLPLEVEIDSVDQCEVALNGGPDIILLDNMEVEQLRECVRRRDAVAPRVLLEASGGVTLQTIDEIAATGVNRVSVGALTHSAPAMDIALDFQS